MKQMAGFFFILLFSCFSLADSNCIVSPDQSYTLTSSQIRTESLAADFIHPKDCLHQKTLVVFGGSEGGINTRFAKRFAKLGYGVYALGYFNVEGTKLPKHLVQVPIEYFKNAIEQIKSLNKNSECCYLVSGSKGAEAILTLLALTGETYKRAVLLSGSDRVLEGLGKQNRPAQKSSWLYSGKDVPYTPMDGLSFMEYLKMAWNLFKVPPQLRDMYLRSVKNKQTGDQGLLRIENISTKILFLSGEDDNLWPSTVMAQNLETQFRKEGLDDLLKHTSYSGAGHAILGGHVALQNANTQKFLGGNIKDSKVADEKAFKEIFSFLEEE